jgi:hypothetical protein
MTRRYVERTADMARTTADAVSNRVVRRGGCERRCCSHRIAAEAETPAGQFLVEIVEHEIA